jgi:hypothetical protein
MPVPAAVSPMVAVSVVAAVKVSAASAAISKDRHSFDHAFAQWVERWARQREQIPGPKIKPDKQAHEACAKKDLEDRFHA